jgi:iron complex outermembrane receptor protein
MSNFLAAMPRASHLAVTLAIALAPATTALAVEPATSTDVASRQQQTSPDPQHEVTTLTSIKVVAPELDRIRTQQSLTPGAVSVVDGSAFEQRSVNNVADALRDVPGVWAQSPSGSDDVRISIRGSNLGAIDYDNNGVTLFQDGLPVTTADGNNHNRIVNPLTARDMIVARGANALAYGASDLGGAIDFISRTARNSNPRQVFVKGGSDGLATARASVGGVSDAFDGMLTAGRKIWDGYRRHGFQKRVSFHGNAGWRASDNFRLRTFAAHIDSHQQLPGALTRAQVRADRNQANPQYARGNHQLNVKSNRLAAKGEWQVDPDARLEFGVSYEGESLYHPIVTTPFFSLLIDTRQRTLGAMIRYHLTSGDHQLVAGANVARTHDEGSNYANRHGHRGARQDAVDTLADSVILFALDRWQFAPHWTLVYGTQGVITTRDDRGIIGVDTESPVARDRTDRYTSINPRLGLIHALTPQSQAFASVSRLYEAPDNFDLDNVRTALGRQATLKAMQGTVAEVGWRGITATSAQEPRWRWNLSLYYARIHDEILSVRNPDPSQNPLFISGNIDHTIHAGIEAMVRASFPVAGGRIQPRLSATWNRFTFDADPAYGHNDLPSVPDWVIRGEVMYHAAGGFFVGPTLALAGPRFTDYANTYKVGGYGLFGLRAGFENDLWSVFAELDNGFDKRYIGAVAPVNRMAPDDAILSPGAPRSVFVGVRITY